QPQWKGDSGTQIDASNQKSGAEAGFTARQSLGIKIVRPVKRRVGEFVVCAPGFNSRSMKDRDHITGGRALEILVALEGKIVEITARRIGSKGHRFHFRVDRLDESLAECQAEDERTQVVDISDAAEIVREITLGRQAYVTASLVYVRVADA